MRPLLFKSSCPLAKQCVRVTNKFLASLADTTEFRLFKLVRYNVAQGSQGVGIEYKKRECYNDTLGRQGDTNLYPYPLDVLALATGNSKSGSGYTMPLLSLY